jgi:hypothetical protein
MKKAPAAPTSAARSRLLRDIVLVARGAERRVVQGWVPKAHFTMNREIVASRKRFNLFVGLHVVPGGGGYRAYRATIGIWPKGRERFSWEKADYHPVLVRSGWYVASARLLRRYGYQGNWKPSPWGRFADFERTFRTPTDLIAELKNLELLYAEPWWVSSAERPGAR